MSSIKSENTRPEIKLRKTLWKRQLRYQIHDKSLPGKPDIVFTKVRLAVFVDGDFWHGNNWKIRGLGSFDEELKTYSPYWQNKLLQNVERDKKVDSMLKKSGWTVCRIWESDIKKDVQECANRVEYLYWYLYNNLE